MNRKWPAIVCMMAALTVAAKADETNAVACLREAEDLAAARKFAPAATAFAAVLPAVSNSTHECYAKARLAACLLETAEYQKAIVLCDEVVTKWPRGAARFSPIMVKADCLTALGRTNEAFRVYREHYSKHNPDVHVTDEDIRQRMEAIKKRTAPTTPPTVPPPAPGAGGVR